MKSLLRRLYRSSVWHPDNLDPGAYVYRNLERVWLPVFDLICALIGFLAMVYGSRILNAQYAGWFVDLMGYTLMTSSLVALIGVCFPRLWTLEVGAKIVMLGLLGAYSATIWASFFTGQVQSGFVAAMLMLPVLFPLFRLQVLGEERKKRKSTKDL